MCLTRLLRELLGLEATRVVDATFDAELGRWCATFVRPGSCRAARAAACAGLAMVDARAADGATWTWPA